MKWQRKWKRQCWVAAMHLLPNCCFVAVMWRVRGEAKSSLAPLPWLPQWQSAAAKMNFPLNRGIVQNSSVPHVKTMANWTCLNFNRIQFFLSLLPQIPMCYPEKPYISSAGLALYRGRALDKVSYRIYLATPCVPSTRVLCFRFTPLTKICHLITNLQTTVVISFTCFAQEFKTCLTQVKSTSGSGQTSGWETEKYRELEVLCLFANSGSSPSNGFFLQKWLDFKILYSKTQFQTV